MGDGEDIGSDLEGDEEEEEDEEDGGFVVPDGYGSDDCEADGTVKNKKRKLEQIVHYRALPADLAELLTVQVLDKLPLCLSNDPNVHLEENIDYFGLLLFCFSLWPSTCFVICLVLFLLLAISLSHTNIDATFVEPASAGAGATL